MNDYKSAKEAFVADNTGTSVWTVNAVSLVGLVSTAHPASLNPAYLSRAHLSPTCI